MKWVEKWGGNWSAKTLFLFSPLYQTHAFTHALSVPLTHARTPTHTHPHTPTHIHSPILFNSLSRGLPTDSHASFFFIFHIFSLSLSSYIFICLLPMVPFANLFSIKFDSLYLLVRMSVMLSSWLSFLISSWLLFVFYNFVSSFLLCSFLLTWWPKLNHRHF